MTKQMTIEEETNGAAGAPAEPTEASAGETYTPQGSGGAAPETAVQKSTARQMTPVGTYGIELRDLASLWGFAKLVSESGLSPRGMDRPQAVAVAIQLGLELGLSPMSALQNIAVINGRPGIYGDAASALVLASGDCEVFREFYEGEGEKLKAVCEVKRKGQELHREEFSVADAKQAKLWAKEGPWSQYPKRMLRFRARGFALRDVFPDKLKGIKTVEEIGDYIEVDAAPEPVKQSQPKGGNEAVKERLGLTKEQAEEVKNVEKAVSF